MTGVGYYEIKPPIYEEFLEKKKCTHTKYKLENGFIYLY